MNFGLTILDIQKLQNVFKNISTIDKVIIFGSRARNTYTNRSDIDFAIDGKNINFGSLAQQLDDLLLPYTIDIILLDENQNNELLGRIKQEGKIFYSKIE